MDKFEHIYKTIFLSIDKVSWFSVVVLKSERIFLLQMPWNTDIFYMREKNASILDYKNNEKSISLFAF